MQLRLAFSVAAHLEPEILIIDEVLSVGDLAFQEKCLGPDGDRRRRGSDRAVRQPQPDRGLEPVPALDAARVGGEGHRRPDARGDRRVRAQRGARDGHVADGADRSWRHRRVCASRRSPSSPAAGSVDSPATGEDFEVVLRYETADAKPLRNVNVAVQVLTLLGDVMVQFYTQTAGVMIREAPAVGEVRCLIPRCPLPPGQYTITLWADQGGDPIDWIQRACELTVREGDFYGSGKSQQQSHHSVLVDHRWSVLADGRDAGGRGRAGRGAHDVRDLLARLARAFDAVVLWRLRRARDRAIDWAPDVGERLYRSADAVSNLPFRSESIELPEPLVAGGTGSTWSAISWRTPDCRVTSWSASCAPGGRVVPGGVARHAPAAAPRRLVLPELEDLPVRQRHPLPGHVVRRPVRAPASARRGRASSTSAPAPATSRCCSRRRDIACRSRSSTRSSATSSASGSHATGSETGWRWWTRGRSCRRSASAPSSPWTCSSTCRDCRAVLERQLLPALVGEGTLVENSPFVVNTANPMHHEDFGVRAFHGGGRVRRRRDRRTTARAYGAGAR